MLRTSRYSGHSISVTTTRRLPLAEHIIQHDSAKAVDLYVRAMADAIIEGRNNAVTEVVKAAAAEGSDEFVEVEESAA